MKANKRHRVPEGHKCPWKGQEVGVDHWMAKRDIFLTFTNLVLKLTSSRFQCRQRVSGVLGLGDPATSSPTYFHCWCRSLVCSSLLPDDGRA